MEIKKEVLEVIRKDKYISLILALNEELRLDIDKLNARIDRLSVYKNFATVKDTTYASKIRRYLKDNKQSAHTPAEIARKLKIERNTVDGDMRYMAKRGEARRTKIGGKSYYQWK